MIEARGFPVEYGSDVVARLLGGLGSYVIVVHPEPWDVVRPALHHDPLAVIVAGDLGRDHLESLVSSLPPSAQAIVGLGGGSAMDTAKWLHWRSGVPLYQVPSLPSVDACFTRMTALRDRGGVHYEGDSVPELVLVDLDLMRAAPASMVRGGIGDVLSCHTARFDWKHAAERGRDDDYPWVAEQDAAARAYLEELEEIVVRLARPPGVDFDEGVRRLMECHRDIGWRCHELGHARFEEGSEHFFAYAFESVTGHAPMHGELVALGVLVMSAVQGNDPDWARRMVDTVGMRSSLEDLSTTWAEVESSLRLLPQFVVDQGHWYSVANDLSVDDDVLEVVRAALRVP